MSAPAHEPIVSKPRRWPRRLLLALLILGVAGELSARYILGLGDPPLMLADPEIEYLFQPNQDCRRFGKRIAYNAFSMRSDNFPGKKSNPNEFRVLVVGDSIVNGGALTDQANLATTLLGPRLSAALNRPVVVGNVSAGSWGPPNELAYLRRFGLFDADVVAVVLSSNDAYDVPTFEARIGKDPGMPDQKPLLALTEGFSRYVLRALGFGWESKMEQARDNENQAREADRQKCLAALKEIFARAQAANARPLLVLHLEKDENPDAPFAGQAFLKQAAREAGVEIIELAPAFIEAKKQGHELYRDHIHPNDAGQRILAEVLTKAIQNPAPPARLTERRALSRGKRRE